jgi:5,10-methylenetetrahydromethanopterin reductase
MRLGIFFGARRETPSYNELIHHVRQAEADGFSHFWVPHLPTLGFDALTTLALAGRETTRIELGTDDDASMRRTWNLLKGLQGRI